MIWGVEEFVILAMLTAKYLQIITLVWYKIFHCKHMFLCYIMFCIHFLNISSRGRRKSRWNKRIAEQNPGGVEAGALYGGENTCQVNESNILFGKPQFVDFGINVIHLFKWLWKVFWRAVSVFSITVYAFKCIWTQKYRTYPSLKFIKNNS